MFSDGTTVLKTVSRRLWIALFAVLLCLAGGPEIGLTLAAESSGGIPAVENRPEPEQQQLPADTTVKRETATIYGPGLWNNRTACGLTLTRRVVGVAHSSLACGTKVTLSYKGKSIMVRVIDRLPVGGPAKWDLTVRTAKRLGLASTDEVSAATSSS